MGYMDRITFSNLGIVLEDHNGYYKILSIDLKQSITWACYDRYIWFERLKEWNKDYQSTYEETIKNIMLFSENSI